MVFLFTDVTVDPTCESYKLGDLKAATAYQIQVSGFTSAGAGVRSSATVIKTLEDQGKALIIVL